MDLTNEVLHWSLGVVTSVEPDEPELKHALVRGDNIQFASIGAGKAKPRTREGMTLVNQTPYSNSSASAGPAIVGGGVYPYLSAGAVTHYSILVSRDGDVHLLLDDGSTTTLAATVSFNGVLTNDLLLPDFAVMNNRAFLIDALGDKLSVKATAEVDWGVAPVTGLALAATGVGSMTGDYDVLVTGWNSQTSAESDRSAVVSITGLSAEQLRITVNAVAVGLTHRFFRVYLRKPSLGSGFFRVTSGTGYDSTQEAFPLYAAGATTTTDINISDATLTETLISIPPPVAAHGLPPVTNAVALTLFQRRLFLATREGVFWSELDKPDAWNPASFEPVRARDPRGGDIVGMKVFNEVLHIFTTTARITLTGDTDIRTWVWDVADPSIGATSARAIAVTKQRMYWYDKEQGPVMMGLDGATVLIGQELIRDDVSSDEINTSRVWEVVVAAAKGYVVFYVPEFGKTRLTKGIVFHADLLRWVSTRWDPMDASFLLTGFDTSKKEQLYLCNYNGQVFRLFNGENDGVRTGTSSGTFVASGTSVTVITDAGASFDTTGGALKERKVTVLDADGIPVTTTDRPRIASNTGTALTLSVAVTGLVDGATYTYLVGGPDVVLESFWDHMGYPFTKKRFDRLFFEFRAIEGLAQINVAVAVNKDPEQTEDTEINDAAGSLWDSVNWDEFVWDSPNDVVYSLPVIRSGRTFRFQLRSTRPDQPIVMLKQDMLARRRADRYRRG